MSASMGLRDGCRTRICLHVRLPMGRLFLAPRSEFLLHLRRRSGTQDVPTSHAEVDRMANCYLSSYSQATQTKASLQGTVDRLAPRSLAVVLSEGLGCLFAAPACQASLLSSMGELELPLGSLDGTLAAEPTASADI